MTVEKRKFLVGLALSSAAVVAIWWAFELEPWSDWSDWILFAAATAILNFPSVEVDDHLLASSSVMAVFTGGVVFALDEGSSAAVGMGLLGVVGGLITEDLRGMRVFRLFGNAGQMAVSGVAVGWLLDVLLRGGEVDMVRVAIAGAVAAIAYTSLNLGLVRVVLRLIYGVRSLLPWSRTRYLFLAQSLMGLVGGLLGWILVPADGHSSGVLPLVVGVFVLAQLVFFSYSRLRSAHEDTLRGFVKTLEARDLYMRGHTERVARFTRMLCEHFGLSGTHMEQMRWAALIHDVGKLAVPVELMDHDGLLNDEQYRRLRSAMHQVDDLLSGVDFLKPVVVIASGCHTRLIGEDFGQSGHVHTTQPTLEQKILAVADAFDAITTTRSYRMARSQRIAFEIMRESEVPLMDRRVIDELENALRVAGETYGPPEIETKLVEAGGDGDT